LPGTVRQEKKTLRHEKKLVPDEKKLVRALKKTVRDEKKMGNGSRWPGMNQKSLGMICGNSFPCRKMEGEFKKCVEK